jgi:predicted lipid-binding transport protein (Tim44 family)
MMFTKTALFVLPVLALSVQAAPAPAPQAAADQLDERGFLDSIGGLAKGALGAVTGGGDKKGGGGGGIASDIIGAGINAVTGGGATDAPAPPAAAEPAPAATTAPAAAEPAAAEPSAADEAPAAADEAPAASSASSDAEWEAAVNKYFKNKSAFPATFTPASLLISLGLGPGGKKAKAAPKAAAAAADDEEVLERRMVRVRRQAIDNLN